jgi:hypothetical protein
MKKINEKPSDDVNRYPSGYWKNSYLHLYEEYEVTEFNNANPQLSGSISPFPFTTPRPKGVK